LDAQGKVEQWLGRAEQRLGRAEQRLGRATEAAELCGVAELFVKSGEWRGGGHLKTPKGDANT
jgi:hypothetical protein